MLVSFAGALIGQSQRSRQGRRSYGIQPGIDIDIKKTDTIRVVEAYDRLMDCYVDPVHTDLAQTKFSGTQSLRKLDSIEKKTDSISACLTRIERALDIPQTRPDKNYSGTYEKANRTKEPVISAVRR